MKKHTSHKLSREQKLEMLKKYKTNQYSYGQLAREYGITQQAVTGLFRRRGYLPIKGYKKGAVAPFSMLSERSDSST